jgi:hypothetical protein
MDALTSLKELARHMNRHSRFQEAEVLLSACDELARVHTQLTAAEQRAAEAEKDAERLNWIEHQDYDQLQFTVFVDMPCDGMTGVSGGVGWHKGKTLRAAIDAARASNQTKEQ